MSKIKYYCATCTRRTKRLNAVKCPTCDGWIRKFIYSNKEKVTWSKKGMIWVQKRM